MSVLKIGRNIGATVRVFSLGCKHAGSGEGNEVSSYFVKK